MAKVAVLPVPIKIIVICIMELKKYCTIELDKLHQGKTCYQKKYFFFPIIY